MVNTDGKHRKTDPNGVFTDSEWAPPTPCRCEMMPTMCLTHPMKPRQEVSAMAQPRPVKLEVDTTSLDTLRALTQSINEATTRLQEATQVALDMLTDLQGAQKATQSVLCQVCGGSGLGPHNPDDRDADDQCPTCMGTGMVDQMPAQDLKPYQDAIAEAVAQSQIPVEGHVWRDWDHPPENVSGHTMQMGFGHADDGRQCWRHARLDAFLFPKADELGGWAICRRSHDSVRVNR